MKKNTDDNREAFEGTFDTYSEAYNLFPSETRVLERFRGQWSSIAMLSTRESGPGSPCRL